ncbi:MAG: filamentous hemagglutinin N-terminal domain-containing protein [Actinomycetota bacterium]
MRKATYHWQFYLPLFIINWGICIPVWAQVTPDGTLKTTVSRSGNHFIITNGSAAGSNLFHSFQQFSVPTGGTATFDLGNTPNISTIFSRVTGGSISNIDGLIDTLHSNNAVSLFLLNPRGIIFGPNAQLNLGGSFVATTANRITFADGTEFNAINPNSSPLLTVTVPTGLQFGPGSGAVAVYNSGHHFTQITSPYNPQDNPPGLQVTPGHTLALLGNGINLTGGVLRTNGSIELGSVQTGQVRLTPTEPGWGFNYANVQGFNDIKLDRQALIDGTGFDSSRIQLQGRNIQLLNSSMVATQNLGASSSNQIAVNATESLQLFNTRQDLTSSAVFSNAVNRGRGADITVATKNLVLQEGGQIQTRTFSSGAAGEIRVSALESMQLSGFLATNPRSLTSIISLSYGSGNGGDVTLSTQQLSVTDGSAIGTSNFSTGNSGNVQINVSDSIYIAGINRANFIPTSVASSTLGAGRAGNVNLTTARLMVHDGGSVESSTGGIGNAGNLYITASDWVEVSGASPSSILSSRIGAYAIRLDPATRNAFQLPDIPSGNAGGVILTTPELRISERGDVGVRNDGTGDAGNFQVNADRLLLRNQGTISATTQSGNGGNLILQIQNSLLMRNNSKISADAKGGGNGGNISIHSPTLVGLENSDIIANAVQGRGGNIQINTQGIFGLTFRPQLTPDSDITASSEFGVSGTVQINNVNVNPASGLVNLPSQPLDPSQRIITGCASSQGSRFVATGRGGIPPNPTQQVTDDRTWGDVRDLSAYRQTQVTTTQPPNHSTQISLIEANGWVRYADGQVVLVADSSGNHRPDPLQPTCAFNASQ